MRILLSHRFYWPDSPPYAAMLRRLAGHLAEQGHEVVVLSGQPSYRPEAHLERQPTRQRLDGVVVRRVGLLRERKKDRLIRGINAGVYSLRLFFHILTARRYDLVTASTFPPILAAFLACCACRLRGTDFVYHCQDLHPEVSAALAGRGRGWLFRLLSAVDTWTCRHAARVVTLSEDMRGTLCARTGAAGLDIEVINNFDLPVFDEGSAALRSEEALDREPHAHAAGEHAELKLIFAGNIGRFQNLETLVQAMAGLSDLRSVTLIFVGDGSAKPKLQGRVRESGDPRILFRPYLAPDQAKGMIANADFGVVSLLAGMEKVAYPSKTMSYLGQGCPILAIVERNSELARSIEKDHLGLVVDSPATPDSVASAVRRVYDEREHWRAQRQRLRDYARRNFSETAILARWDALLSSL